MKIRPNELLKESQANGVQATAAKLAKALRKGKLKPEDLSLKQLAEAFITDKQGKPVGRDLLSEVEHNNCMLSEAAGNFIDPSAFSTIFNQFIYNVLIPQYLAEEFAVANSFGVVQTSIQNGELVPGISNLGDVSKRLGPGQEFPRAQPTQDYLRTRPLEKYGFLVSVEWEAAIHDNTGLLLERAKQLGSAMGLAREKQACDVLIDSATPELSGNELRWQAVDYRYNWKDVKYQTYMTTPNWDNTQTNGLNDYVNVNQAEALLRNILDPFTGEYIRTPTGMVDMVTTQDLWYKAHRIQHTIELRTTENGSDIQITDGEGSRPTEFRLLMSKYLKARLARDSQNTSTWYWGHLSEAFKWMSYVDIVVEEEANPGRQGVSFTHQLLTQFRAYRYQSPIVFQPRYIVRNTP